VQAKSARLPPRRSPAAFDRMLGRNARFTLVDMPRKGDPGQPIARNRGNVGYIASVAPREDLRMKQLLTSVAVFAALALSAPVLAQQASPSSDTSSATPPSHRHAHHAAHGKPSHHPSNFPNVQGNVANQLNHAELARLQSGNMSMPPAAPPPGMAPSR
jgi:hypothetical protein